MRWAMRYGLLLSAVLSAGCGLFEDAEECDRSILGNCEAPLSVTCSRTRHWPASR
jgi:hypothetical protein